MKNDYLLPAFILLGIGVLFFFPSPESNFLAYVGTAVFFIMMTIVLIRWRYAKGGKN